jgi:hypothetical protein
MGLRPLVRRGRAVFRRFRDDEATSSSVEQSSVDQSTVVQSSTEGKTDTDAEKVSPIYNQNESEADPEKPNAAAQHGVRDAEAITLTWTKATMIFVFMK